MIIKKEPVTQASTSAAPRAPAPAAAGDTPAAADSTASGPALKPMTIEQLQAIEKSSVFAEECSAVFLRGVTAILFDGSENYGFFRLTDAGNQYLTVKFFQKNKLGPEKLANDSKTIANFIYGQTFDVELRRLGATMKRPDKAFTQGTATWECIPQREGDCKIVPTPDQVPAKERLLFNKKSHGNRLSGVGLVDAVRMNGSSNGKMNSLPPMLVKLNPIEEEFFIEMGRRRGHRVQDIGTPQWQGEVVVVFNTPLPNLPTPCLVLTSSVPAGRVRVTPEPGSDSLQCITCDEFVPISTAAIARELRDRVTERRQHPTA